MFFSFLSLLDSDKFPVVMVRFRWIRLLKLSLNDIFGSTFVQIQVCHLFLYRLSTWRIRRSFPGLIKNLFFFFSPYQMEVEFEVARVPLTYCVIGAVFLAPRWYLFTVFDSQLWRIISEPWNTPGASTWMRGWHSLESLIRGCLLPGGMLKTYDHRFLLGGWLWNRSVCRNCDRGEVILVLLPFPVDLSFLSHPAWYWLNRLPVMFTEGPSLFLPVVREVLQDVFGLYIEAVLLLVFYFLVSDLRRRDVVLRSYIPEFRGCTYGLSIYKSVFHYFMALDHVFPHISPLPGYSQKQRQIDEVSQPLFTLELPDLFGLGHGNRRREIASDPGMPQCFIGCVTLQRHWVA